MKSTSYFFPLRALALGALLVGTSQCSVSDQVKESPSSRKSNLSTEAQETLAYDQIQYRLNFMDEAKLGGQDILFVRQASDFTPAQQAKLQTALQAGNLPLRLRMRVYARNSSQVTLQLKQLDYQLFLDGRELTKGSTGANTALESSAIVTLPVDVDLKLTPALLNGSTPAAFAAGLADFTGSARRLTMRIRPTYVSASGRVTPVGDFQPAELVTRKASAKR
ncbi:hypothetical protein AUC43_16545 [Hymenobacter sedentarius]|uniref:Late embryogenesis abundant protein LEA-2 subgroup domain-containing protein n=1 Tax=Hymenobacter sedentarius TaxID=1411621 RepID=A0A0U3SK81_9BACT|nr:hypothetical protein [Hymenobacter sedentarius]ALW86548.1 hypothetical protein AUC43_16545 [Hymenobacter sedentarius]